MKVIAVESDPIALTLTLVAEFEAAAERVWQVWADPRANWSDGGALHR